MSNTTILKDHHIITQEGKNCTSVNACKDACKHRMSPKECVSKINDAFLGVLTSSNSEIELTPPNQINYSTRVGSSVKRKLDQNVEESGGTPKTKADQYYSKPDTLKLPDQLKTKKRRCGYTGLLGLNVCSDAALNRNKQVSDFRMRKPCVVCGLKTQDY